MARKAISPVVATLILIVIAVVAAVAVFGFIQGFIAQTTTNAQAPSNIIIDAASVNTTAATYGVNVTVRNVGQTQAKITAVYVLDPSDLSLIASDPNVTVTVSTGSVAEVHAFKNESTKDFIPNNWANKFVIVKVVTSDGASATYKVMAD